MDKIAEIEARRAARKAASEESRQEQYAKDLEAVDALEVEAGESLGVLQTARHVAGLPSMVAFKAPSKEYYKRFTQQVRRAGENLEARGVAIEMLADSCWVYPPDTKVRKDMIEAFPGVLNSIAAEITKLVELKSAEEGKG